MSGPLRFVPKIPVAELYPKGAIVVCHACGVPLYKLQAALYVDEPIAKSTWKYAPVSIDDVFALLARTDLEPGQRAMLKTIDLSYLERIVSLKAGDFADCVACKKQFVYATTRGEGDGAASFADKGYQIQLAVIPPFGKARPITAGRAS
jgi:hypothetical protein